MSPQSYPLHWPPGFPRSKQREYGRFKTSYDSALANVERSLRSFAADSGKKLEHAIMSSNMTLIITPDQTPRYAFAERGVEFVKTSDGQLTFRVGKRAAGRLLDGVEHSAMLER